VVITLLFLTQYFYFLPKAVLAAIIMTAVAGLVDVPGVKRLWAENRVDFGVAAVTFAATLGLGIQIGMAIGVGTSFAAFVWRTARPTVVDQSPVDDELHVMLPGPLYFGNVEAVENSLETLEAGRTFRSVVLDTSSSGTLDSVALGLLDRLRTRYEATGCSVRIVKATAPVSSVNVPIVEIA
jgi:SulP family sulfate permease